MRMRKKKHAAERLFACQEIVITDPSQILNDGNRYELEIGCGKGSFICELARRNPDKRYIALEKVTDIIMLAAEKAMAMELPNLRFLNTDAKNLPLYFGAGQVSQIYLNFSDPWPKKGYYKRRLTYSAFLDVYKSILVPHGGLRLKTDNPGLFEFSLESLAANGFEIRSSTDDLHHSVYNEGNIMTEYETQFAAKGMPIHWLDAYLK